MFTLDFTHFANGDDTTSDLVFVNLSTQPVRPAIYFYDTEGVPCPPNRWWTSPAIWRSAEDGGLTVLTEMEPLGELTIPTHGQGELVSGSVKVISNGPIGGMLRFDLPGIGEAVVGSQPAHQRRPLRGAPPGGRNHHGGRPPQPGRGSDGGDVPIDERGRAARRGGDPLWRPTGRHPGSSTRRSPPPIRPTSRGRCAAMHRRRQFSAVALEMDPGTRIFLTLPLFPVNRRGGGRAAALDFAHFANGDGTTSDLVFVNVSTQRSRPAPTPFHTDIPPIRPAIYFYDTEGNPIAAESVVDVTGDLEVQEDGALTVLTDMEPLGVLTVSTHGQGRW